VKHYYIVEVFHDYKPDIAVAKEEYILTDIQNLHTVLEGATYKIGEEKVLKIRTAEAVDVDR